LRRALACLSLAILSLLATGAAAQPRPDIIFIHHSIGRGFLHPSAGAVRDSLADWNRAKGTSVVLWDHDYGPDHPIWGLRDPAGVFVGYGYGEEFNNTLQVSGYRALFCTANAARDSLLANHDVIAFKPGYESGWLWLRTDEELASAKADYLLMRDFFDQHPEKTFVVVTQPPIHRNAPYLDERKDRARALSRFLTSHEFLGGRANVRTFDLFDLLATPDKPGDPYSNTLYYGYELNHDNSDPHPNELANTIVGAVFARFLYAVATDSGPVPAPAPRAPAILRPCAPNPFNPRTELRFTLAAPGATRLTLHDAAGRLLATLVNGDLPAGDHAFAWDGRDGAGHPLASGVYFARLQAAGARLTQKLTLAR